MNSNLTSNAICSISDLAFKLDLSRARFYQLQKLGVFPPPVYCIRTKRPFYPIELQDKCLEIRRTRIDQNGHLILFYAKRHVRSSRIMDSLEHKCEEISTALKEMGLKIARNRIKKAVKLLHPKTGQYLEINGELIAELFRYFQNGV